jgi:hypothetical protein
MLARDVQFLALDPRHWARWRELLLPPMARREGAWMLIVIDRDQVCHAVRADRGAVDLATIEFLGTSPAALAALRRRLAVDFLAVLEADALSRLLADAEAALRLDTDYASQCVTVLRAARRLAGAGVWTEPRLLEILPAPPAEALQQTFDLLAPDDTSLVVYLMADDRRRVATSLIARKRAGHIDLVTTHRGVADLVSEASLAVDWRAQYKRLLRAVGERFAPPSLGVFTEEATLQRILRGPSDQLARELATRQLILDPAPPWLLGLLGGATVAAAATRSARSLARFLPTSARRVASELAHGAREVIRDHSANPLALLGFDPLALWNNLRAFYRGDDER